ncbi:MAG: hypothetical protein LUQ35_09175 [Methanoregula sp.]|nr:hypothetical protein [Methanoregula sp.]
MASSDPSGLYLLGFIVFLIIGLFAYAYLNKRITADKQKQLIKAFRASPTFVKDAPVFVQGQAQAPDVLLPTTGEHVAYYGMFVLSKETAVTDTRSGVGVRVNGIPLGTTQTRIDSVEGFTFFETSGDFTVASGGSYYFVRASSVFAYYKKGMDLVSGLVRGQFAKIGMPESVIDDNLTFKLAEQALTTLCGFNAPILEERSRRFSGSWTEKTTTGRTTFSVVTAKSRIDARVQNYLSGYNLPQGVQDLITKHGHVLAEKEEVIVIETFIPLNKEVFVFGTFDGDKSIVFADNTVQLSVSYTDPSGE